MKIFAIVLAAIIFGAMLTAIVRQIALGLSKKDTITLNKSLNNIVKITDKILITCLLTLGVVTGFFMFR